MANPRTGVILPTTVAPSPTQLADFAVRAEALGYASLWAGDTLIRPVVEPLTALAAVLVLVALLPPATGADARQWGQRCRSGSRSTLGEHREQTQP
ncbi:hypothetical protein ACFQ1S_15205 [Kibdelosporangium lantanae]|uniref:Luciferase-like domain-containing protein n=1 Tax=Kibdelosporangium lantanae TaxID=1497396 RepID=A0ABW3M7V7_9PSEU